MITASYQFLFNEWLWSKWIPTKTPGKVGKHDMNPQERSGHGFFRHYMKWEGDATTKILFQSNLVGEVYIYIYIEIYLHICKYMYIVYLWGFLHTHIDWMLVDSRWFCCFNSVTVMLIWFVKASKPEGRARNAKKCINRLANMYMQYDYIRSSNGIAWYM